MSAEDSFYWISIGYLVVLVVSVGAAIRVWWLNDKWERGAENRLSRRYANYGVIGLTAAGAAASVILFFLSQVIQGKSDVKVAEANRLANEAAAKTAEARSVADSAQAQSGQALKDAAEANERAGKANERAASLELKAAEANERATKSEERIVQLNLQIEKIRSPRVLQDSHAADIANNCSKFSEITYVLGSVQGNQESLSLMISIHDALVRSGWKISQWQGSGFSYRIGDISSAGYVTATGVVIGYSPTASEKTISAANALGKSINEAGIYTTVEPVEGLSPNYATDNNAILVAVGNKRE